MGTGMVTGVAFNKTSEKFKSTENDEEGSMHIKSERKLQLALFATGISALIIAVALYFFPRQPYPGPFSGKVIDAETGLPVPNAVVTGMWSKHDLPIPDISLGTKFIEKSVTTGGSGEFQLPDGGIRGGWNSSDCSIHVSANGWIPKVIILEPTPSIPQVTLDYPFIDTISLPGLPEGATISLRRAEPVYRTYLESDDPRLKKEAEEALEILGTPVKILQ